MPAKIFVNYRRDDDPSAAARVRDGLVARYGQSNVFMDVDNLLAGQRFDQELTKALAQCDVLVAIIGPRWMEMLKARAASGERDYVREEIAGALQRKIVVIPARVGREGQLIPLPRQEELPEEIRELALYQKHDVVHEHFGRDVAELVKAISTVRGTKRPQLTTPRVARAWIGASTIAMLAAGYVGAYYAGVPVPWLGGPPPVSEAIKRAETEAEARRRLEQDAKVSAEENERLRAAASKAQAEAVRLLQEVEARRAADESERQRLAAIVKQEEDRKRAEEEARRKADAAARAAAEARAEAQRKAEADRLKKERERAECESRRRPQEFRNTLLLGSLLTPGVSDTTLDSCWRACDARPSCVGVSLRPSSRYCVLFQSVSRQIVDGDADSAVRSATAPSPCP